MKINMRCKKWKKNFTNFRTNIGVSLQYLIHSKFSSVVLSHFHLFLYKKHFEAKNEKKSVNFRPKGCPSNIWSTRNFLLLFFSFFSAQNFIVSSNFPRFRYEKKFMQKNKKDQFYEFSTKREGGVLSQLLCSLLHLLPKGTFSLLLYMTLTEWWWRFKRGKVCPVQVRDSWGIIFKN